MAKRGRFSLRIRQIWPRSKSKPEELGSVTRRKLQGAENEAPRVLLQLFLPTDLKLRYQTDSIASQSEFSESELLVMVVMTDE